MMLCVRASLARKSSTWAMSTEVLRPSETTAEKPTAFWPAQSSIDAVSAPDCDTSASGPALASGAGRAGVELQMRALQARGCSGPAG